MEKETKASASRVRKMSGIVSGSASTRQQPLQRLQYLRDARDRHIVERRAEGGDWRDRGRAGGNAGQRLARGARDASDTRNGIGGAVRRTPQVLVHRCAVRLFDSLRAERRAPRRSENAPAARRSAETKKYLERRDAATARLRHGCVSALVRPSGPVNAGRRTRAAAAAAAAAWDLQGVRQTTCCQTWSSLDLASSDLKLKV